MASPVKYTFDHAFDGGAKSRFDLEIEEIKNEAEQTAQSALQQGMQDGRAQALTEIEAQTLQVMEHIRANAQSLFEQQAALESRLKNEMVDLAYAIASKLSSALIRSQPIVEIQAVIQDCLQTVSQQPRLVVRVSEAMQQQVGERIEAMKTAANFSGDIVLIAEPSLGPNDCRVEWPDGGSERNYAALQEEVETVVQRYVMSDVSGAQAEDETVDPNINTDAALAASATP